MLEKLFLTATITISLHLFANLSTNTQNDRTFGQLVNPSVSVSIFAQG